MALGEKNFIRVEPISPLRGAILDRNGKILASNRPVFNLYWNGSGKLGFSHEEESCLNSLTDILGENFLAGTYLKDICIANRYGKRVLLKSDLVFSDLCKISEQCTECSNLEVDTFFSRIYPYKNLASHILGYLSRKKKESTTLGVFGLEKILQDDLKGQVGAVLNVINSKGRRLSKQISRNSMAGKDIKLTIDWMFQSIADGLFEKDQVGAFILMDPSSGDILAMTSFPNFDPNIFLRTITQKEWDDYFGENNPFLNRAIQATYPPASLFKLVTFAAGLEEGVISTEEEFDCKGNTQFCGRKYHCIRHWGHGKLDAKAALAYSCNIPCFQIAQKLKINQLSYYAFRLGLGRKTGFLLSENSGLVPTYEWKVASKGERWWKGETLSASIGQSYTLVTPLQVARMVSGICSGFLIRPRILMEGEIEKEKLHISEPTLDFLRESMRGVALRGSAKMLGRLKGFDIYAKTGTAQTTSLSRSKISKKYLEHAWLATNFSYKGGAPLTMVVLVEHVGASIPATKIAAKFLRIYKKMKESEMKNYVNEV